MGHPEQRSHEVKRKKTETFRDRTRNKTKGKRGKVKEGRKQAGRVERGRYERTKPKRRGKQKMKWGEAWLVRGVPPRHSLLINQPPTTLPR